MEQTQTSSLNLGVVRPKKKLLYLAVCDPDLEVTGVTVRMGAFIKHLSRFYDITLVNMAGSGHHVDPNIEQRSQASNPPLPITHRVRVPFAQAGYFLFSPALFREADQLLKTGSYDYLLVDYGLAAVYGILLARRYQIPLIYSSANVEYRMYLELGQHDPRRLLLAPYVYWAERTACRVAKLVVTVSDRDAKEYEKWIPRDRLEVIPQGFDPDVINPFYRSPPSSPPVVLFVGSFKDENNRQAARQIVQEIVPQVIPTFPDITFQLIGSDPPSDLAGPNVVCPGFVDDIGAYLQRANLVIAPMSFGHGISTKVVLGLAFGKIVLTTPPVANGMPQQYRQLQVAPLEHFAPKIVELLSTHPSVDSSDFNRLCQDFAWPDLIARLSQKIEACCTV